MEHPYVKKLDGKTLIGSEAAAFILANYGAALRWQRADSAEGAYRLVGFQEWEGGSATMWAYCRDGFGLRMVRSWPDAPGLPEVLPGDWHNTGIIAAVKETGAADWGVGRGEAYFPTTNSGVCKVWMHTDKPSDIVEGWGWLDGTAYRQLCPVFLWVEGEPEPEPEPDDELLEAILAEVRAIHVDTAKIAGHFA